MENVVFTIGHSTHSIEEFLSFLKLHGISAICDVRSSPYSRFNPQFNKESLSESLRNQGIKYVPLGKEFGARSDDPSCYSDGRVQYDELSRAKLFRSGLKRVRLGLERGYKMALMCAEKDPLDCHRTVLVSRKLENEGLEVVHILSDGSLETQTEATERLVKKFNLDQDDLFLSEREVIEKAFLKQEEKIAYIEDNDNSQIANKVKLIEKSFLKDDENMMQRAQYDELCDCNDIWREWDGESDLQQFIEEKLCGNGDDNDFFDSYDEDE